jgi:SPP1 family predicted phage head-tail adaptor
MSPLNNAPMLAAGSLNRRIVIEAETQMPFAVEGQPASVWAQVRECWAAISTSSSKEWYMANQFSDDATHLVVVRWSPIPLAAGMRIRYKDRCFTVQNVENVQEGNVKMNLICIEIDGVSS